MRTVRMSEILKAPGLEEATHGIEMEPKPRHLSIELAGVTVYIESTAHKVMDALIRFSHPHQRAIVGEIIKQLPKIGDSMVLHEDKLSGQETAIVTRGRSESGPGILLIFSR